MMNEQNHIDKYFKDKLFDHEIEAPGDLWAKIDDQMNKKRKKLYWSILGAMAASFALIIATGIGYHIGKNNSEKVVYIPRTVLLDKKENTVKKNKPEEEYKATQLSQFKTYNSTKSNNIIKKEDTQLEAFGNTNKRSIEDTSYNNESNNNLDETIIAKNLPEHTDTSTFKVQSNNMYFGSAETITTDDKDQPLALVSEEPMIVKKGRNIKWQIGANIAPVYSYRSILENNTGQSSSFYNDNEKAIITFSGGLNVHMVTGRLRLESGIFYANMGQQIENAFASNTMMNTNQKNDLRNSEKALSNSTGNVIIKKTNSAPISNIDLENQKDKMDYTAVIGESNKQPSESKIVAKQLFNYIEIPLIAHYNLLNKKLNMSVSGGLSANFLIGNNVYIEHNGSNENIGTTANVRTINYAGLAGLSFEYPVTNRILFRFEPRVRYYLNSLVQSDKISTHLYNFGIYTGLSYKF